MRTAIARASVASAWGPPTTARRRRSPAALAAALLVGLVFLTTPLRSQEMPVPATVQVPMFVKIFPYVRSLGDRSSLRVWVTFAPEQKAQWSGAAAAITQAFRDAGVEAEAIASDQLAPKLARGSVVYLLPGANTPPVLDAIAAADVLSISGAPAFAERGDVSIGLGAKGGKPEIIVHAGRLKAEGQEVASQLIGLARLVH